MGAFPFIYLSYSSRKKSYSFAFFCFLLLFVTSLEQIVSLEVKLKRVTAGYTSVFLCNVFLTVMPPEVI